MDQNDIKRELTAVCKDAIEAWLRTIRGANTLGAKSKVTEPQSNTLLVSGDWINPRHGPTSFEIKIT